MVEQACISPKVVDEHSRASSEIELGPCKEGGTDYFSFPHWSFLLDIQINCLGVPSSYTVILHQDIDTLFALLLSADDVDSGQNFPLKIIFDLCQIMVFELACVEVKERFLALASHSGGNPVELVGEGGEEHLRKFEPSQASLHLY